MTPGISARVDARDNKSIEKSPVKTSVASGGESLVCPNAGAKANGCANAAGQQGAFLTDLLPGWSPCRLRIVPFPAHQPIPGPTAGRDREWAAAGPRLEVPPAPAGLMAPVERAPSERLEVLDDRHAFVFGQSVPKGMPAVAATWLGGVVNLAAFPRRQVRSGAFVQYRNLPAELNRTVSGQVQNSGIGSRGRRGATAELGSPARHVSQVMKLGQCVLVERGRRSIRPPTARLHAAPVLEERQGDGDLGARQVGERRPASPLSRCHIRVSHLPPVRKNIQRILSRIPGFFRYLQPALVSTSVRNRRDFKTYRDGAFAGRASE